MFSFFFLSSTRLASDGRRQIDWSCRSCRSNHICNPQWHVYTETLRNGGHQRAGAAAPFHGVMKRKKSSHLEQGKRKPSSLTRLLAVSARDVPTWKPSVTTQTDTENEAAIYPQQKNADSFHRIMNKSQDLPLMPEECWLNVDPHTSQNLCLALIYIGNRAEDININGYFLCGSVYLVKCH